MILHIARDEKFIDIALRLFEQAYSGQNICFVVSKKKKLDYIKSSNLRIVDESYLKSEEFTEEITKSGGVVLHSLFSQKIDFPDGVKVAWIGWGFDYYDLLYTSNIDLLDKDTEKLALRLKLLHGNRISELVKKLPFVEYLFRKRKQMAKLKYINNNITYFLPVLPSEYDKIKFAYPQFKPQYLDWNYGSLDKDLLKGVDKSYVNNLNVLVGNSSSVNNNHIEVFTLLKTLKVENKEVIVPLSYGDKLYREKVIARGEQDFGEMFSPLVDFIELDEYISKISSCAFVIMNHVRQQALGNIIIMMHLGAKIFLKKENPIYDFLIRQGAIIFSTEELLITPDLLSAPLTSLEVERNRKILMSIWSEEVIVDKTKALVSHLLSNADIDK